MAKGKNPTVADVMKEASTYIHLPENLALIEKAAKYASEKHAGMFRKSGEPYLLQRLVI